MSSSFVHYFHLGHAYEVRSSIGSEFMDTLLGVSYYTIRNRDEIEAELISTANTRHYDYEDSEGIEDLNQVQEHFSSSEIEQMIDEMPDVYLDDVEFFSSGDADHRIDDWIRDNNIIQYITDTIKTLRDWLITRNLRISGYFFV